MVNYEELHGAIECVDNAMECLYDAVVLKLGEELGDEKNELEIQGVRVHLAQIKERMEKMLYDRK